MEATKESPKSLQDLISPSFYADMADIKEIAKILVRIKNRRYMASSTEKIFVDALNQLLGESINLIGVDPAGIYISDAQ